MGKQMCREKERLLEARQTDSGRARPESPGPYTGTTALLLRNTQFNRTGITGPFVLLTKSFYWQLRALRRNSNGNIQTYTCPTASPISLPQPLGSRMRILFGVSLIFSTLLSDKENPFPTKLKLLFHPNKHYTPGTHQNKNKLIFKYLLEKKRKRKTIRSIKIMVLLCAFEQFSYENGFFSWREYCIYDDRISEQFSSFSKNFGLPDILCVWTVCLNYC